MSSTHTPTSSTESFTVVRRGFDRDQVAATLARLRAEVDLLRADRDAAVQRAERLAAAAGTDRGRIAALEARVAELGRAPLPGEQMSDRLSTMLSLATAEAGALRDAAHQVADRIRADAEEEAWTLRQTAAREAAVDRDAATAELAAARSRAEAVRAEHAEVLSAAHARAEQLVSAAENQARQLDALAAVRRGRIDEDHRLASDARRSAALREDDARREASEAAAEAVRRDAGAEAAALVKRARHQTRELRGVREQIVTDLAAIRARLEPIPGRLDTADLAENGVWAESGEPGLSSTDG